MCDFAQAAWRFWGEDDHDDVGEGVPDASEEVRRLEVVKRRLNEARRRC